jgi:hypothetical protein
VRFRHNEFRRRDNIDAEANMAWRRSLALVVILLGGCGSHTGGGNDMAGGGSGGGGGGGSGGGGGGDMAGALSFFGTFTCSASQSQVCQGGVGGGTFDISAAICPMPITMGASATSIVTTHHDTLVDYYTASDSTHASLTAPETYPDFPNPAGPGTITMFKVDTATMTLTATSLTVAQNGTFVWSHGTNTSCTFTRTFTGAPPH